MAVRAGASTVREALQAATDAFRAAGVESPRLDAEVLLGEATRLDRASLAADPDVPIEAPAARSFAQMVRRRVRREPVAYILGRKGFRRIELKVDRRVLIPRPETELLVERAASAKASLRPWQQGEALRVLEVGTGSGAVALAIADEIDARVTATDSSSAALDVARANAKRLGLADRVRFVEGTLPRRDDLAERNAEGIAGYDLIVANLPYVSQAEWKHLAPEIREYEPREALVAGASGLEAIEGLFDAFGAAPRVHAHEIALEIGAGQADAVAAILRRAGYKEIRVQRDLAGTERVVAGGMFVFT